MTKKYFTDQSLESFVGKIKEYTDDAVSTKADSSHTHDGRYYTESEVDTKLAAKANSSHTHALSDLSSDSTHRTVTDAEKATWNAKSNFSGSYNDLTNKPTIPSISGLATETYVDNAVSTKVDKVSGKGLSTNDYTTTEKNKLSGIATGAEVNQNAFSNVVVGSTTIAADSKTDSLTIAAGAGISVSADATNDKVTITNAGIRSVATGSSNGTISVNANGASVDIPVKGLGSAAYTASTAYDAAGSADTALASAKEYADKVVSDKANTSHTHTIANVSGLQSALDGKVPTSRTINGKALSSNITLAKGDVGLGNVDNTADANKTVNKANYLGTHDMSNKDLNTIKTAGWYYGYTGMTNAPVQAISVMEVIVYSPDWILQRVTVLGGSSSRPTYERTFTSATTWSNWKTVITTENIGSQSVASATKATKDASGNTITSTYETKTDASTKLAEAIEHSDSVQANLDTHTSNADVHVTTTNKSNWNTAYTHSQSAHARTDATKVADSTTNGNILINGTETNVYTHPNSGVTAGTYKSVTVNAQGHITAGTNPTTLAGYGITDAEAKGAASSALASAKEYTDSVASGKSNTNHNHDTAYDKKGSADSALASAKSYADTAATNAANAVKNDLLNGAGGAYDTLKELGDLIDDNADAIDALETVAAGKADKSHSHAIADVSGLQSALDGKAASSHGTHVSYSTTAPVMDGTASVGTASTVARSDHKHPTDTSRASKTEFDSHTSNTTAHITSTERSNWNAAKTHADSAHAPSNAQPNQNAFSNITVGSTTVAADSPTDTVTFAGSNITITPDATNDKVTFSVADATTSAKGVVQLTDSTSSTSTTTAATPKNVKAAYDLANTAKTNAATAQSKADSAYNLANSKVDSLSDLGITATAAELNYVDGVTSNVQTQLDSKLSTSGGDIDGGLIIKNTENESKSLYLRRGTGTSEQVRHYVDDSSYHLVYTNDEVSNSVKFEMTSTDTETGDGTNKSTSVVTFSNSGNKSTVTANTFSGSLSGNATSATKATKDGDGNVITSTYAKQTALDTLDSAYDAHKHSVSHTPAGTVSKPTFTGSAVTSGKPDTTNATTIYSITGVGTLPSASLSAGTLPSHSYTAPSLTAAVSNRCLTLTWSAGSHSFNAGSLPSLTFSAGSLPTRSSAISMPNANHTHSVTAAGSVSQPTFTGTEATLTTGTPK